jgi:hypothetical protein
MGETYIILTHKPYFMFKFHDAFATHFSPHQFRITIKGGYEIIIHDVMCTMDFHRA